MCTYGRFQITAIALATARFPRHHALKWDRTFLATHLATVVAVAVNSDTALVLNVLLNRKNKIKGTNVTETVKIS